MERHSSEAIFNFQHHADIIDETLMAPGEGDDDLGDADSDGMCYTKSDYRSDAQRDTNEQRRAADQRQNSQPRQSKP